MPILLPLLLAVGLALSVCDTTATAALTVAATPAGQLFCSIQLAGGGGMVAAVVDAEASALLPAAAPIAILATDYD